MSTALFSGSDVATYQAYSMRTTERALKKLTKWSVTATFVSISTFLYGWGECGEGNFVSCKVWTWRDMRTGGCRGFAENTYAFYCLICNVWRECDEKNRLIDLHFIIILELIGTSIGHIRSRIEYNIAIFASTFCSNLSLHKKETWVGKLWEHLCHTCPTCFGVMDSYPPQALSQIEGYERRGHAHR